MSRLNPGYCKKCAHWVIPALIPSVIISVLGQSMCMISGGLAIALTTRWIPGVSLWMLPVVFIVGVFIAIPIWAVLNDVFVPLTTRIKKPKR